MNFYFDYAEIKKKPWYLKVLFTTFSLRSLKLFRLRLDNMIFYADQKEALKMKEQCEADVKEFLKNLPNLDLESSPLDVYPMGSTPRPIDLNELRRLDKKNVE